jgi:HNH endonuclease
VRVYEKIRNGIWSYNGMFDLVDCSVENSGRRDVFKFSLVLVYEEITKLATLVQSEHRRVIPSGVKLEVWKRDGGKCVECGSHEHLHFDHVIPFSRGGASITAENVQLLCAKHNLEKHDQIR